MPIYRAWRIENAKRVQEIEFEAKTLRAAKLKATQDLVVEYGLWTKSIVFLPSGKAAVVHKKWHQGSDGTIELSPKIQMIEVTSQENDR